MHTQSDARFLAEPVRDLCDEIRQEAVKLAHDRERPLEARRARLLRVEDLLARALEAVTE